MQTLAQIRAGIDRHERTKKNDRERKRKHRKPHSAATRARRRTRAYKLAQAIRHSRWYQRQKRHVKKEQSLDLAEGGVHHVAREFLELPTFISAGRYTEEWKTRRDGYAILKGDNLQTSQILMRGAPRAQDPIAAEGPALRTHSQFRIAALELEDLMKRKMPDREMDDILDELYGNKPLEEEAEPVPDADTIIAHEPAQCGQTSGPGGMHPACEGTPARPCQLARETAVYYAQLRAEQEDREARLATEKNDRGHLEETADEKCENQETRTN
ncbi:MAG: hypothetical protein WAM91_13310 [Candidatus Acidiferrales bacterium]